MTQEIQWLIGLLVTLNVGALGLLWVEVNRLRKWRHDEVAQDLQIIIGVLEANGFKVPERRKRGGDD